MEGDVLYRIKIQFTTLIIVIWTLTTSFSYSVEGACVLHTPELLYNGHDYPIAYVQWSPEGNSIASSFFDLRIWNSTTGNTYWNTNNEDNYSYHPFTWSPDGSKIAWIQSEYKINIYNVSNGHIITALDLSDTFISDILWSQNGEYLLIQVVD